MLIRLRYIDAVELLAKSATKRWVILKQKRLFKMVQTSYTYTTYTPQPSAEAFITKSKDRLKQHGNVVYLKNGDNFEIELFNPRTVNVLVKIKLNGSYIPGGGLVLKPGQRYHLDRYLDVAKKFVFNTYEIDGGDSQAVAATAQNGLVEVEFYDERPTPSYNYNLGNVLRSYTDNQHIYGHQPCQNPNVFFNYNNAVVGQSDLNASCGTFTVSNVSTNVGNITLTNTKSATLDSLKRSYTSSAKLRDQKPGATMDSLEFQEMAAKSLETGRVEKGGHSNQKFNEIDMDFNSFTSSKSTWVIKPESTKPVETKDLKVYCTECGAKQKPAHKFCPHCGTKVGA